MDITQLAKTVAWLDDERRKDRQEITALQERLTALTQENLAHVKHLQQLEGELATTNTNLQRVSKVDSILDGYRKEMVRQVEELERRRAEAEKDVERIRKLDREAVNKALTELRKSLDPIPKYDRELAARKEEETRLARLIAELQLKVSEFNKHVDERNRMVTVLEEGRRQDVKRIGDLQAETADLRRRFEEWRGKLDIVEDIARRSENRLAEVFLAETDRKNAQAQWLEAQTVAQGERDRAFGELRSKTELTLETMKDYARRIDQYTEAFREMRRIADEARQLVEVIERRVAESTEIHRLGEERFRQDWASFLADDQKRWATHMLLRDEQWREHDRLNTKHLERVDAMEDQTATLTDQLRQMQAIDLDRIQALLSFAHGLASEYEKHYTKVS
jgi:chromosome segregation ATPase